jgi:polyhydroxyalkanoate synthesis regulator phasin
MQTMESGDFRHLLIGIMADLRERTEKMASELVEKGKKGEVKEKKSRPSKECRMDKEIPTIEDLTETVGRTVERFLGQMGLLTKSDMDALERRINSLERKVDRLAGTGAAQEKKPRAAKKTK